MAKSHTQIPALCGNDSSDSPNPDENLYIKVFLSPSLQEEKPLLEAHQAEHVKQLLRKAQTQ
jgi:hypothetical protein